MKFRLRFILLILIMVNSMGYDWLHTLWHLRNGPRMYQMAGPETDILTNMLDDRLVDTSQPGNTDFPASDMPITTRILIARSPGSNPKPVEANGIAGYPFAVFKPPRITAIFS